MASDDKILMIGLNGVFNFGCEAIVRGTWDAFRKVSDYSLIYGSKKLVDDTEKLKDCEISIIDRGWRDPLFHRILGRINREYLKGRTYYFSKDPLPPKNKYRAVLSVGGDIYNPRSDGSYPGYLMKFGDALYRKEIPYIMWGASMGPFDTGSVRARKAFFSHVNRVPLVVAREQVTIDYLKSIDFKGDVFFGADPAFLVAPELVVENPGMSGSQPLIAINLSPLSVHALKLNIEDVVRSQVESIKRLVLRTGARILLVPHVLAPHEGDNDFLYMKHILTGLNNAGIDAKLISEDLGFIGIKRILVQCDLVVAARMHCAINGLASAVPTIFLSYSPKSVGVCEYVYGDRKNVYNLSEFGGEEFLRRVEFMLNSKPDVTALLLKRRIAMQADVVAGAKKTCEWLDDYGRKK